MDGWMAFPSLGEGFSREKKNNKCNIQVDENERRKARQRGAIIMIMTTIKKKTSQGFTYAFSYRAS